jgi:hypothetical protein
MIDQQTIHADMQRIFPSGASAPVERGTGRPATRALATVPTPRRRLLGREGIAAAGFALAVTAIGLFAAPLMRATPPSPPPVAAIAPAVTIPAAVPAPSIAAAPIAPAPMALAASVASPAPVVAAAPSPTVVAPRPSMSRADGQRRLRADRVRRAHIRRRVGARTALQRAWARDRVLTRRLNQQALRRMQAR